MTVCSGATRADEQRPDSFSLRALGVDATIRYWADAVAPLIDVLGCLRAPAHHDAVSNQWSIDGEDGLWWFRPGLLAPSHATTPLGLLGAVLQQVNRIVNQQSSAVAVHSGAVAKQGRGVLLAGPSESGKSTLTAGLVRAGTSYLGDEAIGIDDDGRRLRAYPKPVTLDHGSQHLFPELEAHAATDGHARASWHVPIEAVRADAAVADAEVAHMVLCRYEAGARTSLIPVSRAEAVLDLTTCTFRFDGRPRRSLDVLGRAAQQATCHRLVVGDLATAVDIVLDLLDHQNN